MTLDDFLASIRDLTGPARDAAVLDHLELRVPWPLVPVPVFDRQGRRRGELRVAADVFALGTPEQPVRVPLTGRGAQALADRLGMMLPTSRIASLVYDAGQVVLAPHPMGPPEYPYDDSMLSTERFELHNLAVEEQRAGRAGLVVGHHKDVVVSRRLAWSPGRLAIYGWFTARGKPLQPLQLPHEDTYADYSHGIRLVAPTMLLDGVERRVADVLRDPATAALVSDEGPLDLKACRYAPLDAAPRAPAVHPEVRAVSDYLAHPAAERLLRVGCVGADVRAWQGRLAGLGFDPGPIDGAFGRRTDVATRAFQARARLVVDGIVGPATRRAAWSASPIGPRVEQAPRAGDIDAFVQAKHFTKAGGRRVDLVVLHSTESPCRAGGARAVAEMFATTDREASAHFVVDSDEVIGCVAEEDVAWAAPGANHDGVQVELTGYAAWTEEQWREPGPAAMLARAVKLVASIVRRHGIAPRVVGVDGLLRDERGLTRHVDVSRAFHRSTHHDPGGSFPFDWFVEQVAFST